MGLKKKIKESEKIAVPVETDIIEQINELSDNSTLKSSLISFAKCGQNTDQIAAAKQVVDILKQHTGQSGCCTDVAVAMELLVRTYLKSDQKNPLKRILASGMQSLPKEHYHSIVVTHLVAGIETLQKENDGNQLTLGRHQVNMIASLMDNFSLGEESLIKSYEVALVFLANALDLFLTDVRKDSSPVVQNEKMHDCLATLQAFSKLLQKVNMAVSASLQTSSHLQQVFCSVLTSAGQILKNENFLLDCRSSSGIAVTLTLRVTFQSSTPSVLLNRIFPAESGLVDLPPCPEWLVSALSSSICDLSCLSVSAFLCLCNGLLAILGSEELAWEYAAGHTLLVDVIGKKLISVSNDLFDTKEKLLACRTLELWTSRASHVVQDCSSVTLIDGVCGKSVLSRQIQEYACTYWEDPVDAIRHLTRVIFDNLIKLHFAAVKEDPNTSIFLTDLLDTLLSVSWHIRNKYGALCSVMEYMGVNRLLSLQPHFPSRLVEVATHQTTACYASELFEKMFTVHEATLSQQSSDWLMQWLQTWVHPVLEALCQGTTTKWKCIVEYIVPKLLKKQPESLKYIIKKLSSENQGKSSKYIGVLMTCLKRARAIGIIKPGSGGSSDREDYLWNDVVPVNLIKAALCHQDEQIRLDSFGLICENFKTTETIQEIEFCLVKFFLPLNIDSQAPAFRQGVMTYTKKFLLRIKESEAVLRRRSKKGDLDAQTFLLMYKEFLTWLCELLFSCLHVGSSFPRRTTAIGIMRILVLCLGCEEWTGQEEEEAFRFLEIMDDHKVQTLTECLTDSYESNKMEAYAVLRALPDSCLGLQHGAKLEKLFNTCISLLYTTRPQDCTSAAYLLKLLLCQPDLLDVMVTYRENINDTANDLFFENPAVNTKETRTRIVMEILLWNLGRQIEVAKKNLLHAAATQPLYPIMHLIRHILMDLDLHSVSEVKIWSELIVVMMCRCFDVVGIVSPVTSNTSPEGNIPQDAILGPGLTLDAVISSEEDRKSLNESEVSVERVGMMPEFLIVCCWRSIKEVSLLLGQLTQNVPIVDPQSELKHGLVSVEQVKLIDEFFATQLLESRHRGAFELAYAGYTQMCQKLWLCKINELHELPKCHLEAVMKDVRSGDEESRLCSTRRSAGVPFYVQALVTMEPQSTGKKVFKSAIKELLHLVLQSDTGCSSHSQVHALNILRALFRDTRLGEDVLPFVADGMRAAILGFSSTSWEIRNSSTLLFSALMMRIFGVPKSKDDTSRKNCLTGRVFFHRYPSLYQFLLNQVEKATENIGKADKCLLHPGLYPVLMILGKLFPSSSEGTDSSFNLSAFIPYVMKFQLHARYLFNSLQTLCAGCVSHIQQNGCAHSPVFKTRIMAARALRPLVFKDQLPAFVLQLLNELPEQQDRNFSHNYVHGVLLQLLQILQDVEEVRGPLGEQATVDAVPVFSRSSWLLLGGNSCLVVQTAYVEMITKVIQITWTLDIADKSHAADLHAVIDDLSTRVIKQNSDCLCSHHLPGLVELHEALARYWMWYFTKISTNDSSDLSTEDRTNKEDVLCSLLIKSPFYEVQIIVLEFLEKVLSDELDSSDFKEHLLCSENIASALIHVMLSQDQHPQCLAKVMMVLRYLPLFRKFPLRWENQEISLEEILYFITLTRKETNREEVRCACQRFFLALLPTVYDVILQRNVDNSRIQSHLEQWLQFIDDGSLETQTVPTRLSCAQVLSEGATWLLIDPSHLLGSQTLRMWTVVMRLLQDEELEVREVVSMVLQNQGDRLSPDFKDLVVQGDVQSSLALDLCLDVLVNVHSNQLRDEVYHTLLSWITCDLQPPDEDQDQVERLFEKGDLNPYKDELWFVQAVASNLLRFLQKSKPSPSSHTQLSSQEMTNPGAEKRQDIVNRNHEESTANCDHVNKQLIIQKSADDLIIKLTEAVSSIKTLTPANIFLHNNRYQAAMVSLCRLLIAITCVTTSIDSTAHHERVLSLVDRVRSLWCRDCVHNAHIHTVTQNLINSLPMATYFDT